MIERGYGSWRRGTDRCGFLAESGVEAIGSGGFGVGELKRMSLDKDIVKPETHVFRIFVECSVELGKTIEYRIIGELKRSGIIVE